MCRLEQVSSINADEKHMFIFNCLLVNDCKRLAFFMQSTLMEDLMNVIDELQIFKLFHVDSDRNTWIALKDNWVVISKIIESNNDKNVISRELLQTTDVEKGEMQDYFLIQYDVIKRADITNIKNLYRIHTINIPINNYDRGVKQSIKQRLEDFNETLNKINVTVESRITFCHYSVNGGKRTSYNLTP